ncbi:MAG: Crp/Fnr family transcriptional regulator [Thiohalomonadales bacterium]
MKKKKPQIVDIYNTLNNHGQAQLLSYAEYLYSRDENRNVEEESIQTPKKVDVPENESVVAAIRRLSDSYYMLKRSTLLNTSSMLMAQHVMQGRTAIDVIKDLEGCFAKEYSQYCEKMGIATKVDESKNSDTNDKLLRQGSTEHTQDKKNE